MEFLLTIPSNALITFGIVGGFIAALCIMVGAFRTASNIYGDFNIMFFVGIVVMIITFSAGMLGSVASVKQEENKYNEIVSEASKYVTESSYRITVNGEKITQLPDDLTNYDVEFNHDDKIIVLIRK